MNLLEIWKGLGAGARVRALEGEVVRLRAENRALMNSILGIAGVPPVIVTDANEAEALRLEVGEAGTQKDPDAVGRAVGGVPRAKSSKTQMRKNAMPMRRRSWHQVNRMLELDAARKQNAMAKSEE
jgi:hypothetical protein